MSQERDDPIQPVTLTYYNRSYRINNPGPGRVGTHLAKGTPYERPLLVDAYQQGLTGSAFDVGAHIGNHSLWFAAICGLTVHAWEPHGRSLEQLHANLALNDLDITVHEWAAGDLHTTGRFTPGQWVEFDPLRDGATIKVNRGDIAVHPIDDMVDIPDLALVKVDIEGMEPHALRGMVRHLERSHPVVYTEAHTDEDWHAQGSVLKPLGYEMDRAINMGSRVLRWR